MDNSEITCDESIKESKAFPTNFNEKKRVKDKISIFYLHFY